jgi:hypothetical protein
VPLLAEELLHRLQASPPHTTWKVDCSFVEIYNERVRAWPLLTPAQLPQSKLAVSVAEQAAGALGFCASPS